jgi:hypothetical protein
VDAQHPQKLDVVGERSEQGFAKPSDQAFATLAWAISGLE